VTFRDPGPPLREWTDDPTTLIAGDYWALRDGALALRGSIAYHTGDYILNLVSAAVADIQVVYEYAPNRPVMGIFSFIDADQNERLIACDTRRLWEWVSAQARWVDACGVDVFSGGDSDHPWFAAIPVSDVVVITNGVDHPKVYDPAAAIPRVSNVDTEFDSVTPKEIEAAKFVFWHRGRILYGVTKEDGEWFRGRWRWGDVNQYDGWRSPDDYVDFDVQGEVLGAAAFSDDILALFKYRPMILHYTGDPRQLYEPREAIGDHGAVARMGVTRVRGRVCARSATSLVESDGVEVRPFDGRIPDYALSWNPDKAEYTYAIASEATRELLMAYTDAPDSVPLSVLSYDLEGGAFAKYELPFHCFGLWDAGVSVLWDDIADDWDDVLYSFDESVTRAGAPRLLAGSRHSQTWYALEGGAVDDADLDTDPPITHPRRERTGFSSRMRTVPLSPFGLGLGALVRVDLIVDSIPGAELQLQVYRDYQTAPYLTAKANLESVSATDEKLYLTFKRVRQVARRHSLRLTVQPRSGVDGIARGAIHAIIPWFSPVGRLRALGQQP
jgi:hypothetical protein